MSIGRKKIRLDQNDDLFLFDLSERFHSFCSPNAENKTTNVTLDDLYQRLNQHELQYRSTIQLNHEQIQTEIHQNEEKLSQLTQKTEDLKLALAERKIHLKETKLRRRQQSDYLTTLNAIHRYPTRDQLGKEWQQLNQEIERQKSELNHLNQRLSIYQKQSKVVLYSLLELVGFIDVKLPINFEDEIGRLDNNSFQDHHGDL